jgi:hypothetical protein
MMLACSLAIVILNDGGVLADHIPGHDNSDPIFPVPIPGQSDFSGGGSILFVSLIGPNDGANIYDTNLDITYVSDGITQASDIILVASMIVDGVSQELDISGADLGFGSGAGTFVGTASNRHLQRRGVRRHLSVRHRYSPDRFHDRPHQRVCLLRKLIHQFHSGRRRRGADTLGMGARHAVAAHRRGRRPANSSSPDSESLKGCGGASPLQLIDGFSR